jgi:hypothetical protein
MAKETKTSGQLKELLLHEFGRLPGDLPNHLSVTPGRDEGSWVIAFEPLANKDREFELFGIANKLAERYDLIGDPKSAVTIAELQSLFRQATRQRPDLFPDSTDLRVERNEHGENANWEGYPNIAEPSGGRLYVLSEIIEDLKSRFDLAPDPTTIYLSARAGVRLSGSGSLGADTVLRRSATKEQLQELFRREIRRRPDLFSENEIKLEFENDGQGIRSFSADIPDVDGAPAKTSLRQSVAAEIINRLHEEYVLAPLAGVEAGDVMTAAGVVGESQERKATAKGRARNTSGKKLTIRSRTHAIQVVKVLLAALEPIVDYDPRRHHNHPPPALYIQDDHYLREVRELVEELRKLNAFLEALPKGRKKVTVDTIKLSKHVNTFLDAMAKSAGKSLGVGVGGLTAIALASLFSHLGFAQDVIADILSRAGWRR